MKAAILLTSFIVAGGAFAFWIAGALTPVGNAPRPPQAAPLKGPPSIIYGVGYIEPVTEIRKLTFKIDGVIEKCPVEVGQHVKAGDLLCELRNRDEHSAVVVAEQEFALAEADRDKLLSGVHPAEVEAAKRRIAALQIKLKFYQQQHNRELNLYREKVSTEESVEQVASDLHQTEERLKEAKADLDHLQTFVRSEDRVVATARVELARANLAAAKARFDDTLLRAPIDGTVLEILKREGEAVRIYDPTPVLVFGDLSKLRVRAEFDERFVDSVDVGQKAVLFGRGMRDKTVTGKVTVVKTIMGKKTVFSRDSSERKDLEVLQAFIEPDRPLKVPIGLKIDVQLIGSAAKSESNPKVAKSDGELK